MSMPFCSDLCIECHDFTWPASLAGELVLLSTILALFKLQYLSLQVAMAGVNTATCLGFSVFDSLGLSSLW